MQLWSCSEAMEGTKPTLRPQKFDAAAIGALAHLYRGEVYRSTIWRTRLDNTTNWAVLTLGIALSVTFSTQDASPLPLLLAGILCIVFLIFEARRYRYFNVWRARARWMEKNFYAPMLRGESLEARWWLVPGSSAGLLRAAPSHHLCPRHRAAATSQLHMDSRHTDARLLWQDRDPPGANI